MTTEWISYYAVETLSSILQEISLHSHKDEWVYVAELNLSYKENGRIINILKELGFTVYTQLAENTLGYYAICEIHGSGYIQNYTCRIISHELGGKFKLEINL